jgi:hypothetical protein
MSAGTAQSGAISPPAGAISPPGCDRRGHVVHFYGHDDELAGSLGDCLGEALESGAAAVMIGTAGHRAACERRMTQAGVDVTAAAASGGYASLDAAALARCFLADDRTGPGGFEPVVRGALSGATAAGRPAVVYEEIVALLWEAGLLRAAVELESWWTGLAGSYPFWLVCGYPAQRGAAAALDEVARLHESAIGSPGVGPQAVRGFLMARGAPRAARHFAAGTLSQWDGPWGGGTFAVDAAIVVTELAANAVVHARSDFTLTVSRRLGAVRIAVRDAVPVAAPLRGVSGHGLGLVDTVAARWGVQSLGTRGKLVWAELACPSA